MVEVARPSKTEKALIERAFSQYPRGEKKVSAPGVEAAVPTVSRQDQAECKLF